MIICKVFTFDASHQLPKHKGKCKNLHGHTYKLEIEIEGPVVRNDKSTIDGMVADFGDIADVVEKTILVNVDHCHLNKLLDNPTAENLAIRIFAVMTKYFEEVPNPKLKKVRLWETPTSYVECNDEDLQYLYKHQRRNEQ